MPITNQDLSSLRDALSLREPDGVRFKDENVFVSRWKGARPAVAVRLDIDHDWRAHERIANLP